MMYLSMIGLGMCLIERQNVLDKPKGVNWWWGIAGNN